MDIQKLRWILVVIIIGEISLLVLYGLYKFGLVDLEDIVGRVIELIVAVVAALIAILIERYLIEKRRIIREEGAKQKEKLEQERNKRREKLEDSLKKHNQEMIDLIFKYWFYENNVISDERQRQCTMSIYEKDIPTSGNLNLNVMFIRTTC